MKRLKFLTLLNLFLLVAILAAVIQMNDPTAERSIAASPEAEIQRVDMNAEEYPAETPLPKPIPTLCLYDWTPDEVETVARAMYGLNTSAEKFGFVGVAVNRFMCRTTREDGALIFGAGTLTSVVTQAKEFAFYSRKAPTTKENVELAEFYLNVHMTHYLTKAYTGYLFPTNALYFGWDENRNPVVRSSIGAEPLYYRGKDIEP